MSTDDRKTKRELFKQFVEINPPTLAKKTQAFEAKFGHLDSQALAAVAQAPDRSPAGPVAFVALAIAVLLVAVLLAGCSVDAELRRHVEVMDEACRELRDASQPAAGVDSAAWIRLRDSSERAHQTAVEAARE